MLIYLLYKISSARSLSISPSSLNSNVNVPSKNILVPKLLGLTVKCPKYGSVAYSSFSNVYINFNNLPIPSFNVSLLASSGITIIYRWSSKLTRTMNDFWSLTKIPLPTGQSSLIPAASWTGSFSNDMPSLLFTQSFKFSSILDNY